MMLDNRGTEFFRIQILRAAGSAIQVGHHIDSHLRHLPDLFFERHLGQQRCNLFINIRLARLVIAGKNEHRGRHAQQKYEAVNQFFHFPSSSCERSSCEIKSMFTLGMGKSQA
ncbi:MAG: hypothetical protein ALAOOOJD_04232 [bacterium]|nr:hypothetical protein [bacterium]